MATRKKAKKATKARAARRPARPARVASSKGLAFSTVSPSFTVNDLQKSLAWYRDVIGFKPGERWERDGQLMGVELKAGKSYFMIGQDDWQKGRERKKGEGFRIYCTTTQNIDTLAAGIKARGGQLDSEPKNQEWGVRDITFTDPDGFKITIAKEIR
jgi:lactoylglutathione lyase